MKASTFEDRLDRLAQDAGRTPRTAAPKEAAHSPAAPKPVTPTLDLKSTETEPASGLALVPPMIGGTFGILLGFMVHLGLAHSGPIGPELLMGEPVLLVALGVSALVFFMMLPALILIRRAPGFFTGTLGAWIGWILPQVI